MCVKSVNVRDRKMSKLNRSNSICRGRFLGFRKTLGRRSVLSGSFCFGETFYGWKWVLFRIKPVPSSLLSYIDLLLFGKKYFFYKRHDRVSVQLGWLINFKSYLHYRISITFWFKLNQNKTNIFAQTKIWTD